MCLIFSKLKNGLNSVNSHFSRWFGINIVYIKKFGILGKRLLFCFLICIIFFPCLGEGMEIDTTKKEPVFIDCRLMFDEISFKDFIDGKTVLVRMTDLGKGGDKSFSKLNLGKPLGAEIRKTKSEAISNKSTKQGAKDSKATRNICYFTGTKVQFYFYAFLACFIGLIISTILITLFF